MGIQKHKQIPEITVTLKFLLPYSSNHELDPSNAYRETSFEAILADRLQSTQGHL